MPRSGVYQELNAGLSGMSMDQAGTLTQLEQDGVWQITKRAIAKAITVGSLRWAAAEAGACRPPGPAGMNEPVLPAAVLPAAMLPAAMLPAAMLPAAMLPAAMLPAAMLPAAVLPAAMLPAAVLPAAVPACCPAAVDLVQSPPGALLALVTLKDSARVRLCLARCGAGTPLWYALAAAPAHHEACL